MRGPVHTISEMVDMNCIGTYQNGEQYCQDSKPHVLDRLSSKFVNDEEGCPITRNQARSNDEVALADLRQIIGNFSLRCGTGNRLQAICVKGTGVQSQSVKGDLNGDIRRKTLYEGNETPTSVANQDHEVPRSTFALAHVE
jgi:hypothetical protein